MLITRTSIFTGNKRMLDLPVTQQMLDVYATGALLQDAFPNISIDDREFIKSGVIPEEWDAFMPEDEEDD